MGKKMTVKEKKLRAQARERLRKDGFLPPKKAPLNRKKFAAEVMAEWEAEENKMRFYNIMVPYALGAMLAGTKFEVTPEQVGVLKMLKIAIEIRKLADRAEEDGETLTIGRMHDEAIQPILKL